MSKRFSFLLLILGIIFGGTNNVTVFAKKPPKSVCIEESEKQWKKFNSKVLKDIIRSYNIDLSGYQELTYHDLALKVGDNLYDHSDKITLQHLFVGSSIGSMRLFLENGLEGTKGYFLYKRIDGNNVVKVLHKEGKVWVVMSVHETKANSFYLKPFNWNICSEN